MNCTCTLEVAADSATMTKLFATELERQHARSSVTLRGTGKSTIFEISASDITALRATLNSITSVLSMFEKSKEAVHGAE